MLVGAAFLIWIVWDTEFYQSCIQRTNQNRAQAQFDDYFSSILRSIAAHSNCAASFVHEFKEDILAWFTIVLAVSTILLWMATHASARAAFKSADIAETALTVLERPYLIIDARTNRVEPREHLEVRFANHGRSIAFIGTTQMDTFIADAPPPQFKPGRIQEKGVTWVIPGHSEGARINWRVNKTPNDLERVFRGETKLYFLAVITYRDGGGTWYETGICNVYDPENKGLSVAGGPAHNFVT